MAVRSEAEIEAVRVRAQKCHFDAEDHNDDDEAAKVMYETLNWVLGNTDENPADSYLDEEAYSDG